MPKISIPFATTQSNRTYLNTKDGFVQNAFVEQGDKLYVVKRPGAYLVKSYSALTAGDAVTYPAGIARGWIYSHAHNKYYTVIGAKLWEIDPSLTTFTAVTMATVPSSSTSPIYFTETQYGATTAVILHQPGATGQLWTIANGAPSVATLVTSAWVSTSTVGAPVALDTTLYTMSITGNQTAIQGSALSDPTTFTALNSINAYLYPDFGVTLAKFRNQLVCFKEESTEFFYDAANPTGSPLARISEAALQIGCASAPSVVPIDENLLWMSKDQNGGLGFHMLGSQGVQKISTPFIDRILASVEAIVNVGTIQAQYLSFEGHKFYICTIDLVATPPITIAVAGVAIAGKAVAGVGAAISAFHKTLVYDLTTQQWAEWASTDSGGLQSSYFASFCISGSSVSSSKSYSNAVILDKSNGDIYEISPQALGSVDPTMYQDIYPIQFKIVTNKLSGDTRNRKKMSMLEVKGDTNTAASSLNIRYSDNDYQTWSTTRSVDLSTRSFLTNLGMFRNRAFEFTHTDNQPLRLEAFECNVEMMDH
jgi:Phage stabilisation protein